MPLVLPAFDALSTSTFALSSMYCGGLRAFLEAWRMMDDRHAGCYKVQPPPQRHEKPAISFLGAELLPHVRLLVYDEKMMAILVITEGLRLNGYLRWCLISGRSCQTTNMIAASACVLHTRCAQLCCAMFVTAHCDDRGELWILNIF
jgi:hypothetical protein